MTNNTPKTDLRIKKTQKALYDALLTMLTRQNFNTVTVNDLCAEALVSRTAFYAHFRDKYDLLEYFLLSVRMTIIKDIYNYDELEMEINNFISSNKKIIVNIINEANSETLALLRNFMSAIVKMTIKREVEPDTANHIILFNFFIGGLLNILTWLVEHNFPADIKMMSPYLYRMLEDLTAWDAKSE